MGLFFLGFVVWVISTPILCGFTTAAALTIAFGQLPKLLGIQGVRLVVIIFSWHTDHHDVMNASEFDFLNFIML